MFAKLNVIVLAQHQEWPEEIQEYLDQTKPTIFVDEDGSE
jgi:hypothetical protein